MQIERINFRLILGDEGALTIRTEQVREGRADRDDNVAVKIYSEIYHGGYGETVITGVCGTSITGSIPVSHPIKEPSILEGSFILG